MTSAINSSFSMPHQCFFKSRVSVLSTSILQSCSSINMIWLPAVCGNFPFQFLLSLLTDPGFKYRVKSKRFRHWQSPYGIGSLLPNNKIVHILICCSLYVSCYILPAIFLPTIERLLQSMPCLYFSFDQCHSLTHCQGGIQGIHIEFFLKAVAWKPFHKYFMSS